MQKQAYGFLYVLSVHMYVYRTILMQSGSVKRKVAKQPKIKRCEGVCPRERGLYLALVGVPSTTFWPLGRTVPALLGASTLQDPQLCTSFPLF